MNDTIILRVHDLTLHEHLRNLLLIKEAQGAHAKIDFTKHVDLDTTFVNPKIYQDIVLYESNNAMKLKRRVNSIHLTSSHYDIVYSVDTEKDYIQFNFSIPKYLYGHNIAQFVPNVHCKNFSFVNHQFINEQKKILYDRTIKAIKTFFIKMFPTVEVDYKEVEIRRIDICFNQFFDTESQALKYLHYQKFLLKKFERQNSNKLEKGSTDSYSSGISYKSSQYYFKIYHKGSEYKSKGDKATHLKQNERLAKRKKKEVENLMSVNNGFGSFNSEDYEKHTERAFDIEYLQNVSNRILRYELSIDNRLMSYIYKQNIFRAKKCPIWASEMLEYKRIRKLIQRIDKFKKTLAFNNIEDIDEKLTDYKKKNDIKLTKSDILYYEMYRKRLSKLHKFMVEVDTDNYINASEDLKYIENDKAFFSNSLLNYCFDRFVDLFDKFQLSEMPSELEISSKIDDYNKKIKNYKESIKGIYDNTEKKTHGINKGQMMMFVEMCKKYGSLDELKRLKIFDDRTFNNYKQRFIKLGYSPQMLVAEYQTIKASQDFQAYYHEVFNNHSKMFNKNEMLEIF